MFIYTLFKSLPSVMQQSRASLPW